MTTMARCLEGHAFDMDATPTCPRCGSTVWRAGGREAGEKTTWDASQTKAARRAAKAANKAQSKTAETERAREANAFSSSDAQTPKITRVSPKSEAASDGKPLSRRRALVVSGAVLGGAGLGFFVYIMAPIHTTLGTHLPVLLVKASAGNGEKDARICQACHSFEKGGNIKIGPPLYNVVNRPKGGYSGYFYSEAVKAKGGIWTYADLFEFIGRPSDFVPGNKCAFPGVADEMKRADILAFLQLASDDHVPFPKP